MKKNHPLVNKQAVITYQGSSEDFPEGSDSYYALVAWETQGSAIRDNTFAQWIAIGKRVENESEQETNEESRVS